MGLGGGENTYAIIIIINWIYNFLENTATARTIQ